MRDRSEKRIAAFLVVFCVVMSGLASGGRSLTDHDETRVAGIAREMALEGQWSAPRLNGLLFLEYPPAGYWPLVGLLRAGAPASDGVARLPLVAAMLGTLLLTFRMARRIAGLEAGWVAIVALQCTVGFIALNGTLRVDPLLCFWITLALHGALFALAEPARRGRHLAVFYGAIGLAFLSKGLVGIVLPSAVAVVFLAVTRQLALLPRLLLHPALMAFLAPVGLWCFGLVQAEGMPGLEQVVGQSVTRALSSEADHAAAPWFYLQRILYLGLPAVLLLPFVVGDALGLRGGRRLRRAPLDGFGLVWSAVTLTVLSAASAKRNVYLGPIYPGLALAVAVWWARAREQASRDAPQRWITRAVEARPRAQARALVALATVMAIFTVVIAAPRARSKAPRALFEEASAVQSELQRAPLVLLRPGEAISGAAVYYLGRTVPTAHEPAELEALTSDAAAVVIGKAEVVESMTAGLPDPRRGTARDRFVGDDVFRILAIRPSVARVASGR